MITYIVEIISLVLITIFFINGSTAKNSNSRKKWGFWQAVSNIPFIIACAINNGITPLLIFMILITIALFITNLSYASRFYAYILHYCWYKFKSEKSKKPGLFDK